MNQYFTNDSLLYLLDSTILESSVVLFETEFLHSKSKQKLLKLNQIFLSVDSSVRKNKQFFIMSTFVLGLYKMHFLCTAVRILEDICKLSFTCVDNNHKSAVEE